MTPPRESLLDRCDAYLDAVPRTDTEIVEVGAFTLFVPTTQPWPYYGRPTRRHGAAPTDDDVRALLAEQERRGLSRTVEWVHDLQPSLAGVLAGAGLAVALQPLLVLEPRSAPAPEAPPAGIRTRLLGPADPAVPASAVVAALGFGAAGTAVGTAGPAERDAALAGRADDADDHVRRRISRGLTVVAVAEDGDGVVAVGSHQPVAATTEIVGVATLPTHRRRGLAAAVTAALVADARARGVGLVLLSAADDAVARVYERLGFTRVGHAGAAERA